MNSEGGGSSPLSAFQRFFRRFRSMPLMVPLLALA
jgi:hypothetical protein